jgi:hypothetical protein
MDRAMPHAMTRLICNQFLHASMQAACVDLRMEIQPWMQTLHLNPLTISWFFACSPLTIDPHCTPIDKQMIFFAHLYVRRHRPYSARPHPSIWRHGPIHPPDAASQEHGPHSCDNQSRKIRGRLLQICGNQQWNGMSG